MNENSEQKSNNFDEEEEEKTSEKNNHRNSRQNIMEQEQSEGGYFLQNLQNQKRGTNLENDNSNKMIETIIDKLKIANRKMTGEEKIQTFQMVLNNQDIVEVLKELSRQNLEDIVVYILSKFCIEQKNDGFDNNFDEKEEDEKIEKYKDLYFLAIKKGQVKILESLMNELEINFNKIRDEEGNTGLILAVISSDIQIAKFFLKNFHEMIEIKNNEGFSPLLLSVYNNFLSSLPSAKVFPKLF